MSSEHQLRLDPRSTARSAQLLEASRLELQRERAGHVCVRVAAPERERRAEQLRGLGGLDLDERSSPRSTVRSNSSGVDVPRSAASR